MERVSAENNSTEPILLQKKFDLLELHMQVIRKGGGDDNRRNSGTLGNYGIVLLLHDCMVL